MIKYLLDENVLPKSHAITTKVNHHHVKHIAQLEGLLTPKKSVADGDIIQLAIKHNYVVVTRDRGLALNLLVRNKAVVFVNDSGIFYIPGKAKRINHLEDL